MWVTGRPQKVLSDTHGVPFRIRSCCERALILAELVIVVAVAVAATAAKVAAINSSYVNVTNNTCACA